ncbi:cation transporter, partial [Patescibacteria group bacterium]|nr:cation transporter [Patescibacteria group bacterium]
MSVIGLIVGICLFAGQLVVSILTGSIALLSDTFHVLGDTLAILVVGGSQLMAIIAHRFGGHEDEEDYHNVELAATAFNGLLLIGIGIWLFYLAMGRLTDPPEVSSVNWIPGLIGLTVNLSMVALFWR